MLGDDICLWPNGTWCYGFEVEQMDHMSDDYKVLHHNSREYNDFLIAEGCD